MLIILGTAHGKNVSGKQSPDGLLKEYKWSREICHMIKERLNNEGIDCIIDIEDDIEKSLSERVNIVNNICEKHNNDCIYVSIHINASGSDGKWHNANGWTVWVYEKCSQKSKEIALDFFEEAKKRNLLGNRWVSPKKYNMGNLYVLRKTLCPAILTENMFQDNKDDVNFLLSEQGKREICDLHVESIKKILYS